MPIPEFPYVCYGLIMQGGAPKVGVTVTIENLTLTGSDTCVTDSAGHYIYSDLAQLPNGYNIGDTIEVSVTGKSDTFIAASEPEEKEMNLTVPNASCHFYNYFLSGVC